MNDLAKPLTVAIRVDAGAHMGAGHLQRCLTLADALRRRGARSSFVCRSLPAEFGDIIERKGHDLIRLPPVSEAQGNATSPAHAHWLGATQAQDASQTLNALSAGSYDWLVVDHYGIDATWEAMLRSSVRRILVIDDLADRPHDCDLLLDQNYYCDLRDRYRSLVSAECRELLGPRYALLRPEFAAARQTGRARNGKVGHVLVFFGGADADNYTALALEALDSLGRPDLQVDVVLGLMSPHRPEIEARCAQRPNTRFFHQVDNMSQLVAAADLALGAAGSATWERCCLGLPTLAVAVAQNQRRLLNDLCRSAYVLSAGNHSRETLGAQLAAALRTMVSSEALLQGFSERCSELVDGGGAERVCAAMLNADVLIRPATESDREHIYEWRNHPEIRANSRQPAPISYESHLQWYASTLRDPNRPLLLAECSGRPVAVVRFDIDASCAEVSIYLVPDELAGGWGAQVLRRAADWLQQHRPHVREIIAEVLPENRASQNAFLRAGYREAKLILSRSLA